jgi:hypothetical protein
MAETSYKMQEATRACPSKVCRAAAGLQEVATEHGMSRLPAVELAAMGRVPDRASAYCWPTGLTPCTP